MQPKTFLIAGATGATGHHLVRILLNESHYVKVVVRSSDRLPEDLRNHENIEIHEGTLLDFNDEEMGKLVKGCEGAASCLGHNPSLKGIYGKPRKLVRDSIIKICNAVNPVDTGNKVRMVLMNTAGNRNRDLDEKVSFGHQLAIGIIRLLLPPQPDNEQAAEYLRTTIGQSHDKIEWAAVRPDDLVNEESVSPYDPYPSPIRDPLFNAGKTSRINVADFMYRLLTEEELWERWKGKMPVIYNRES